MRCQLKGLAEFMAWNIIQGGSQFQHFGHKQHINQIYAYAMSIYLLHAMTISMGDNGGYYQNNNDPM